MLTEEQSTAENITSLLAVPGHKIGVAVPSDDVLQNALVFQSPVSDVPNPSVVPFASQYSTVEDPFSEKTNADAATESNRTSTKIARHRVVVL